MKLSKRCLEVVNKKEFQSTTYTVPSNPSVVWGNNRYDHSTMNIDIYEGYLKAFGDIFSLEDLADFFLYSNMGIYKYKDYENRKLMFWYIWQKCIRPIFEELNAKLNLKLDSGNILIEDLTNIDLNNFFRYRNKVIHL